MRRLAAEGLGSVEIGARFKRSPEHVNRILELASLPDRRSRDLRGELRPVERRLLRARADGITPEVLGVRFSRSPGHIRRVLALADQKLAGGLARRP
jgi:hypothetical protein